MQISRNNNSIVNTAKTFTNTCNRIGAVEENENLEEKNLLFVIYIFVFQSQSQLSLEQQIVNIVLEEKISRKKILNQKLFLQ